MTPEEQFSRIIYKEKTKELIPFFKSLTEKDRKKLVPEIKKLHKELSEAREVRTGSSYSFQAKGSQKQIHDLGVASFICFSRKEFEKLNWGGGQIIQKEILDPILSWYCPEWFDSYLNGFATSQWGAPYGVNYLWLMELKEKGFVHPTPELIVRLLPQTIVENKNQKNQFLPERTLQYKETLSEHIWYLFQFPSTVAWTTRYMYWGEDQKKEQVGWMTLFKNYESEGKIDRQKLLQESLLATTRNFDKTLSSWFAELFLELEPTVQELVTLQDELFSAFNSPHSKVVTTALHTCKKIIEEKNFKVDSFLDNMPLLLSMETKSLLSTSLTILEKLIKKYKDKKEAILIIAAQALIHKQDEIQTKVAKLIAKYGNLASGDLKESIHSYKDSLLVNAKTILKEFLDEETRQEEEEILIENEVVKKERIKEVDSVDELVFLASQAFDNNEAHYFDLLPAALIKLQDQIRGQNISLLEPALQRAYKLVMGDWRSNIGMIDHLLATFFINYCIHLMNTYPEEASSLRALHDSYIKKDQESATQFSWYQLRINTLETWISRKGDTLYNTHKDILLLALNRLRDHTTLRVLSTPTHLPCWIDPSTLISRLKAYVQKEVAPDLIDFQVAISRCLLEEDNSDSIQLAKDSLHGEYANLFLFLLNKDAVPKGPFENTSLWIVAAITKSRNKAYEEFNHFEVQPDDEKYTGQYQWKTFIESYTIEKYRYKYGRMITEKVPATRPVLRLSAATSWNKEDKKEGVLKSFLSKLLPRKKEESVRQRVFFEWLKMRAYDVSQESNDIKRLLFLVPHNPEPLLAQVMHHCLAYSTFQSDTHKKMINATLQTLHELWNEFGEMAHLFIATCMISSDKTAASFAAEIWINAVRSNKIDSQLIGVIIGKHEQVELVPLKRFTDLIMDHMFKISEKHNKALEKMLCALILELPDTPIRHLKKLLEIYLEVLTLNGSGIDHTIIQKMEKWKSTGSLEKILKSFEQYIIQPQLGSSPV